MLNGVVVVSAIRSPGTATPNRQKVRRSKAGVRLANAGEELVGAEGEAAGGVDLVDEDDNGGVEPLQRDLAERGEEALHRTELAILLPLAEHLGAEAERAAGLDEQAGVPLRGGHVAAADLRQVDERGADAAPLETGHRAHAERRLAHLAGVEDVAEFARVEGLQEGGVGGALDVARRAERNGSAGNEEPLARALECGMQKTSLVPVWIIV
jgi:hypothetical protein